MQNTSRERSVAIGTLLASVIAIAVTGCPTRIDVSPEQDPGQDDVAITETTNVESAFKTPDQFQSEQSPFASSPAGQTNPVSQPVADAVSPVTPSNPPPGFADEGTDLGNRQANDSQEIQRTESESNPQGDRYSATEPTTPDTAPEDVAENEGDAAPPASPKPQILDNPFADPSAANVGPPPIDSSATNIRDETSSNFSGTANSVPSPSTGLANPFASGETTSLPVTETPQVPSGDQSPEVLSDESTEYIAESPSPESRGTPTEPDEGSADGHELPDDEGHAHGTPINYVERNGPIFVDWPRPAATLLFSGEQEGFLEPCGCAGLENQKGGLMRRHALIQDLNTQGWNVVPLDLGGLVRRFGPQAEIKYRYAVESLVQLGYKAASFGPRDLRLEAPLAVAVNFEANQNPFVVANVALADFDSGFTSPFRVVEVAGKKIGITSILGDKFQQGLESLQFVELVPAAAALGEVMPELRAANCDILVLLSHATPEETKQLVQAFPEFDFVVTAGGAEEPPRKAEPLNEGRTQMIEVGHKGMYVAVVGLYDDSETPFRYQRVPLDGRFKDSEQMRQMMVSYQQELETIGLEGLGLTGTRHPSGRQFVGTAACIECHTIATEIWEESPHAHATARLTKLEPARHFDPECLSCHVTGWDPQKYFPYTSGYFDLKKTAAMVENGCENCHGPGSAHVAAETGAETVGEEEQRQRRLQLRLSIVENEGNHPGQVYGKVVEMCVQCHDHDNSPEFDFQKYWPEVEHYGLD